MKKTKPTAAKEFVFKIQELLTKNFKIRFKYEKQMKKVTMITT